MKINIKKILNKKNIEFEKHMKINKIKRFLNKISSLKNIRK
jgi:hypothetical protein